MSVFQNKIIQGFVMALIAGIAMVAVASSVIRSEAGTNYVPSQVYFFHEISENLFLNASKVKEILDEGHAVILIKGWDPERKRVRLQAAKQTAADITEIDAGWFQPALVYLMDSERITITRTTPNQIAVQGVSSDTLVWMSRN